MAVSRHSLRRVLDGMVHRHNHNGKTDPTHLHKNSTSRSRKKSDRNSVVSNGSLSLPQTCYERLHKSEKEVIKSLNYLDQVLTHHKREILGNIVTSLIENIFDIDSILKGIFEHEPESFRMRLLTDVYSLLADLIHWSDQLLLQNHSHILEISDDDNLKYRAIVHDLMHALKTSISLACDTSSIQSSGGDTRSDSLQNFQSMNSSIDDLVPILPPKREKRPVSSSAAIVSSRCRMNGSASSLIFSTTSISNDDRTKQEQDDDERIQSIVDDINQIVEKYTRELEDALRTTTTAIRSPSIDHLAESQTRTLALTNRRNSIDTLYESQISKLTKNTRTRMTINQGQRTTDCKESCQILNETDCRIRSSIGDVTTQQRTLLTRQRENGDNEHEQTSMTCRTNQILAFDNEVDHGVDIEQTESIIRTTDPPPLPPKRKTARAYMSLFDRYDQNEAQLFLRNGCFLSTPQRRFEDLFEQLHQRFQYMHILSNSDDSLKTQAKNSKSNATSKDNLSVIQTGDENTAVQNGKHPLEVDYHNDLFLENVSHLLVFNPNEDPSLRGGSIDALIIRATSPDKKDFVYQEAFLTTYRTFISPANLVEKLIQRYEFFTKYETKKKIARYAFSLLIRVIDEIDNQLSENMMTSLSLFVTNLIRHGELQLGKLLRRKSLERFGKYSIHGEQISQDVVLIQNSIASKRSTLLDFHSNDISEQLTLLDSELFLKIQLSEILYMSIEKGEEYSPNLAAFTEHFNNISYWARSRILEQNSQRQRENYFEKFLKILKHLRRLNNFNSYLAILSALDCGPLKRLHWSKSIIDAISEHTGLIDSTGSFKNYREALNASVGQPCIPYIGLILSDLTFVHIGNADYLPDGRTVNFWKRWQQFTILHKLRYCRKWEHKFVRNDRILFFFNNFDDFMSEEAQWIQSEKIKPRQKVNPYA